MINVIDKIIEIDNKLKKDYVVRGINLWPISRTYLSILLRNDIEVNRKKDKKSYKEMIFKIYNFSISSVSNNPFFAKEKDIIYLSPFEANREIRDNKLYNIYYDELSLTYPERTLIVESGALMRKKRRYFSSTIPQEIITFSGRIKRRFLNFQRQEIEVVNEFVNNIGIILGINNKNDNDNIILDNFKKCILNTVKNLLCCRDNWKRWMKRISPKIIIYHNSSPQIINLWAHQLRIKTAQYQHGIISGLQPSYNYGDIFFEDKYKTYLPDYLIIRGDKWKQYTRIPSKKITIGYPYFSKKIKGIYDNKIENGKEEKNEKEVVLILSQWPIRKDFVRYAEYLANNLDYKQYDIIFKLHPKFQEKVKEYSSLFRYKNISIIKEGEIYDLINQSNYIISSYSTAIYEALPFKKPIFILKNDISEATIPFEIGYRFSKPNELLRLILNKKYKKANYDYNNYFDESWKTNYSQFLINEIGLNIN
ncbi:CDP-glycerol glycerophosphotransferase family protein [Iocasia frigidifontis]|nr:CDP-glycerol glycerophosphotransferase family protein [Iocasia fonsfrigidae]